MKCSKCNREAVIFVRYNGTHLCREHFLGSVRKRVFAEFHRQVHLGGGERIAVAVSGGKDSTLCLYMLDEIVGPMRDVELRAVMIDEGIEGYRNEGVPLVRQLCSGLGIDLEIVSMREMLGITMDQIAASARDESSCTYCGVFRRRLLNAASRDMGADFLATGLNLDDTAQGIVMNLFRGDVEKLARMGPHNNTQSGLVPRLQPLRKIPEKESHLFCILEGIEFHDSVCPYAEEAVRNIYREVIARIEDDCPGTRYAILSSYDAIRNALQKSYPPVELRQCGCGEPAVGDKCKACQLLDKIRG
ncbi:MAG TPA: TIGR00269 family protein [Euryarchaeota archaeon]|nr:TIGR00269 family protein [Euryarchaeota archaeon]